MELKHNSHKIYGTTLYIGSMPLQTKFGLFEAHTYQNLIHKGYVIALAFGDLSSPTLYTRVHSSCVTSETLGSMDCDCVHQLEGAMQKIAEKGAGILFYLIQEGRGCGYIGKSRACMMVQYYDDQITTFDAYRKLGMKADYRDYSNIKEVLHLMGLEQSSFVLLTNNPDKIKGLQEIGVRVKDVESIEIEPGPFNQAYLISKEQTGHILFQTKKKLSKYTVDYEKVKPFVPYSLSDYSRFIHCASYYIPVKPVKNKMFYTSEELDVMAKQGIAYEVLEKYSERKILVQVAEEDLAKVKIKPYWFKVHMYYDILSQVDYVVLTFGDSKEATPLVRVHSESLFNRFPLTKKPYSKKYDDSIEAIIENNLGAVVLLYHDGKGAGLGHYVLNNTGNELKTGTPHELRDFDAVSFLLSQHLPDKKLKVLYSGSSKPYLQKSLKRHGFNILDWIVRSSKDVAKGHELISQRIKDAPKYLMDMSYHDLALDSKKNYYVLGLGSSNAHAQYFSYLMQKYYKHISVSLVELSQLPFLKQEGSQLVVISQGLSPTIMAVFPEWKYQNIILYTSVTENNTDPKKRKIIEDLKKEGSQVVTFPIEDEYTTLIRIVGPLCGYRAIYNSLSLSPLSLKTEKEILKSLQTSEKLLPPTSFFKSLDDDPNLVVLLSYPLCHLTKNIYNKLIEGAFFRSVKIINYSEFAHGYYQNISHQYDQGRLSHFILLKTSDFDKKMIVGTRKMLSPDFPVWELEINMADDFKIFTFEMVMNYFLLKWLERKEIDQVNWSGKNEQKYLYNPEGYNAVIEDSF